MQCSSDPQDDKRWADRFLFLLAFWLASVVRPNADAPGLAPIPPYPTMTPPRPTSTPAIRTEQRTAEPLDTSSLPPAEGNPASHRIAPGGWTRGGYRAFAGGVTKLVAKPGVGHVPLSMIDQTIVSGTSFLTSIVIGRLCGAEELGVYALAFTLVVLVTNLQTAVVSTPYTIYANRLAGGERREYAGSVLVHCLMLMVVVMSFLALAGLSWSLLQPASQLAPVMWVLSVAMPLLLLREFVRRFAFAHLRITVVLALDAVVAAIQVGGLASLALGGRLSAISVYLVMGVACAIAGGGALLLMKADFAVRLERVLPELQRSWLLGKWIVASRVTALVQAYAVHWLLALAIGTAATGVYAASMTVLLAANPFVIGIGNVLEPRAARAMACGGIRELSRVVWKVTLLLGGVMGLYCGLIMFAGGWIVAWLYQGNQYENQGPTVAVLALAVLIHSWETGAAHGLRVLERPDLSFGAGLLALSITLIVGMLLVHPWGTLGGACAVLAGDSAGAVVRWVAFSRLTRAPQFTALGTTES